MQKQTQTILAFFLAICMLGEVRAIKMTMSIPGLEKQCFYEVLVDGQKYSLETIPRNDPKYEIQISQVQGGTMKTAFYKMAMMGYQRMDIHKLANTGGTYSFCIKNIQRDLLNIVIKFQTGVELMQFELLPDKSDAENLEREIDWLQNQKKSLYQTLGQIQQHKANNMSSSQLLSTKMIVFAILGLISVAVVNYLFFTEVKKTFKERKLI